MKCFNIEMPKIGFMGLIAPDMPSAVARFLEIFPTFCGNENPRHHSTIGCCEIIVAEDRSVDGEVQTIVMAIIVEAASSNPAALEAIIKTVEGTGCEGFLMLREEEITLHKPKIQFRFRDGKFEERMPDGSFAETFDKENPQVV